MQFPLKSFVGGAVGPMGAIAMAAPRILGATKLDNVNQQPTQPAQPAQSAQPTTPASPIYEKFGYDKRAKNLTKAIALQETGGQVVNGKPDYNKPGDNGMSLGAYQWYNDGVILKPGEIPTTFKRNAQSLGLDPNDFSRLNQNMTAYGMVKTQMDEGLRPDEIVAKWNGANLVNGKYVPRNPKYLASVKNLYSQLYNSDIEDQVAALGRSLAQTPENENQPGVNSGHGLEGFLTGLVKPELAVAASGIRSLQAVPSIIREVAARGRNDQEVANQYAKKSSEIMSRPLFGVKTMAGSSNQELVGNAIQAGGQALGFGPGAFATQTAGADIAANKSPQKIAEDVALTYGSGLLLNWASPYIKKAIGAAMGTTFEKLSPNIQNFITDYGNKFKTTLKDLVPNWGNASVKERGALLSKGTGRVKAGGVFRGNKVIPNQQEIDSARAVAEIPDFNPRANYISKAQTVENTISKEAQILESTLEQNMGVQSKNYTKKVVANALDELENTSPTFHKLDPTVKNYVRIANQVIDNNSGDLVGTLKARQQLDAIYKADRGNAAFGERQSALDQIHRAVRNALNKDLDRRAPNGIVRASLKKQTDLYRALDAFKDQATKRSGGFVGRLFENHPVATKLAKQGLIGAAIASGFGGTVKTGESLGLFNSVNPGK